MWAKPFGLEKSLETCHCGGAPEFSGVLCDTACRWMGGSTVYSEKLVSKGIEMVTRKSFVVVVCQLLWGKYGEKSPTAPDGILKSRRSNESKEADTDVRVGRGWRW